MSSTIAPRLIITSSGQILTLDPILRIREAPAIAAHIVQNPEPPAGMGEPGTSMGLCAPSTD